MNSVDTILGAAKKNPEAVLLLAAGAVLLMRPRMNGSSMAMSRQTSGYHPGDGRSGLADKAREYTGAASDKAREYTGAMSDKAREYTGAVSETASEYAEKASDYAGRVAQGVSSQATELYERTRSIAESGLSQMLRQQPLAIVGLGLAAGAVAASVLPATDVEKSYLEPVGEAVADRASQMSESVTGAVTAATKAVKDAAGEKGLTSDGLGTVAQKAREAFTDSMASHENQAPASSDRPQSPASEVWRRGDTR